MTHKKEKKSSALLPDSVKTVLIRYISNIESLSKALPSAMESISNNLSKHVNEFDSFLDNSAEKDKIGNKIIFKIKAEDVLRFRRRQKQISSDALAMHYVPTTFLVSLVSQYDSYLGSLLRVIFIDKPEILNASQKPITFAELQKFRNMLDARKYIVEREIDSIIRDSHNSHFDWMENNFKIPLREGLEVWAKFIEITERRNLFVHCDGIVSKQYLEVCNKHGFDFSKPLSVGDKLDVVPDYFESAYECLFEVGVKLGHVLWRKFYHNQRQEADELLNSTCYDLLDYGKYKLAKELLLFSTKILKQYSSEVHRRMFLINLGIAYKALGESEKLEEILTNEDWSASSNEFQLAVVVLRKDYESASKLMIKIGDKSKPSKIEYSAWPLFNDFRKTSQFLKTYKKVFATEFVLEEESPIKVGKKKKVDMSKQNIIEKSKVKAKPKSKE